MDYLCGELAKAFEAEGAMLPPWRAADAMLSKWRPRRSVDRDLVPPPPAGLVSSAFGVGPTARRSLNGRPAKAQRLCSTGDRRHRPPPALPPPHQPRPFCKDDQRPLIQLPQMESVLSYRCGEMNVRYCSSGQWQFGEVCSLHAQVTGVAATAAPAAPARTPSHPSRRWHRPCPGAPFAAWAPRPAARRRRFPSR